MIITVQSNLVFDPSGMTTEDLYGLVVDVVGDLAPLHSLMANWHLMPASSKEQPAPLGERETVIARMNAQIERYKKEFGEFDGYGASMTIANVNNNRDWRKPGVVVVSTSVMSGSLSLQLKGVEPFGNAVPDIMRSALITLAPKLNATFANTDVKSRTDEKGLVAYQFNRRLYQHREFLGWMGFVPVELTHEQLRDAHEVVPIPGKGTVIVSVPGLFDPSNDAQVKKAHRVEMQLAHYDLLPVTNPKLKD